jgi:sugar O-acyltransferase (sialic acid O-acetyltransferase NeuD family)
VPDKRLLIFGAGHLANCAADAILLARPDANLAFVERASTPRTSLVGIPILNEEQILASDSAGIEGVIVGVGDNWQRQQVADRITARLGPVSFSTVIHPKAHVSRFAQVEGGAILLAGCVVNPSASVGRHAVLWTNSIAEHDCRLADFTTLCPGVALGGCVSVGLRSFVGVGASVRHNAKIGDDVVIAAGATVASDLANDAIYAGTPARLLRKRQPGDRYL